MQVYKLKEKEFQVKQLRNDNFNEVYYWLHTKTVVKYDMQGDGALYIGIGNSQRIAKVRDFIAIDNQGNILVRNPTEFYLNFELK